MLGPSGYATVVVVNSPVEIRRHTDVKSSLGILQDIGPSHRFGLVAGWDLSPRPSGYGPEKHGLLKPILDFSGLDSGQYFL